MIGLLAHYTYSFLTMTSQVAAGNRLHAVERRLYRRLKMCHDRVRREEFPMRQEFLTDDDRDMLIASESMGVGF